MQFSLPRDQPRQHSRQSPQPPCQKVLRCPTLPELTGSAQAEQGIGAGRGGVGNHRHGSCRSCCDGLSSCNLCAVDSKWLRITTCLSLQHLLLRSCMVGQRIHQFTTRGPGPSIHQFTTCIPFTGAETATVLHGWSTHSPIYNTTNTTTNTTATTTTTTAYQGQHTVTSNPANTCSSTLINCHSCLTRPQ